MTHAIPRSTLTLALGVVPLLLAGTAAAQPDPKNADIQLDVPAAPAPSAAPAVSVTPPTTPPPATRAPAREQPPTPASPHTELEAAPPSADQADQWPVVPSGKEPVKYPSIAPYASIVGGMSVDVPIQYQIGTHPASNMADTVSTIMMSDFGVRGAILPWISFESELMANAGASLHGTSAFEGQAALQVRKQVLHLARDWWMVEVGRVIDEASVDYYSYHIADCLMMDPATEPFLLFDGFNLGNGVRGTAEIFSGMRLGFAMNAGTPVSSSAIYEIGGTVPGTSGGVYGDSFGSVSASGNNYPTTSSQAYTFTPSAMYKNKYFEAKAALQYSLVNIDTNNGTAPIIHSYNVRGNVMAHIWDDRIMPFLNVSYGENDTFEQGDKISPDRYTGVGVGGGVDINYEKKYGNYNGFGAMFVQDESQIGSNGIISRNRYYNVGTTYWLAPMLAAGLRFAEYTNEQLNQPLSTNPTPSNGVRSVIATLRLVM
jgi:hypothetical protein